MKSFRITKHLEAVCESQSTRYGFRHIAYLLRDGREVDSAKCCYYNRTWERYEFESVLEKLADKVKAYLSTYEKRSFWKSILHQGRVEESRARSFEKSVALVAKLGDLFADSTKGKNDWKTRILKSGLESRGLIMPDDWDTLSEEEKETRLNGAIAQLK